MMPRIPEGEKGFQFVVSTLVEPTKTINSTKQRLKPAEGDRRSSEGR